MTRSSSLLRWGKMGIAGVGDHGLFSGANFVVAVALGRWLPPDEYGAFAVAFSIHLLLFAAHNAFVLEPSGVIGPGTYGRRTKDYATLMAGATLILGLLFALVLVGVALGFRGNHATLRNAFLALAGSEPGILLLWTARRLCYNEARPHFACAASAFYAAVLLAGLPALRAMNTLTPAAAFWLMGAASITAGLALQSLLSSRLANAPSAAPIRLRPLLAQHTGYGKWFLAAHGISWLSTAAYLPLLGWLGGLAETASLRAIENLYLPVQQVLTVFSILAVPQIVRRAAGGDAVCIRTTTLRLAGLALLISLVYCGAVLAGGSKLLLMVYNNSFYAASALLLPLLATEVIVRSIADSGLGTALRVLKRPDILFRATLLSAVFTVSAGVYLTHRWGVPGAATARALTAMLYLATMLPPVLHLLKSSELKP